MINFSSSKFSSFLNPDTDGYGTSFYFRYERCRFCDRVGNVKTVPVVCDIENNELNANLKTLIHYRKTLKGKGSCLSMSEMAS
ncbi:MAG: hypothetical protein ACTSWE_12660, partial [Promethearchaeota archaeon]